ncbi:MAG: hypothetical protein A2445_02935 [Candidatus Jacksonbacteria bacterium RIFOXYC2_FULL_44_29]|nr:MAG: Segregation and condensation protein A [Parcubacteria group bacterium GW2011_GWA2_42_28]KKT53784.1 MAG: Segregation and condensation protein A [Parcubacteria group bacterium GW2011_GWC2_44_22]OGY76681.1 MAG: hypothetical protein A2240_02155 [Candidatus Jacksonbacteria bacterium RIFOXYA2_FULL_43_12]OGY77591.1 MAG: hypothetical protein A2295_05655 [Candidatus Jacksonbacteria bacterium RIFOXYB2_FULL_44_15]OGY79713.1 MAG: hypothetical protein A2550_05630 [Candidatus Jacksonbacteria bacteriu
MEIKLEQFKGPLDLLLDLIQRAKLDISKVSLANVTDQYLEYLRNNKKIPAEVLVYFIEIASQLILIKTRTLLPYLQSSDLESETDLVTRLKIYEHYLSKCKQIQLAWNHGTTIGLSTQTSVRHLSAPIDLSSLKLTPIVIRKIAERVFKKALQNPLTTTSIKRQFNIHEKILLISRILKEKTSLWFNEVLSANLSKDEIIISFLALLELSRKQSLLLEQRQFFAKIRITKITV